MVRPEPGASSLDSCVAYHAVLHTTQEPDAGGAQGQRARENPLHARFLWPPYKRACPQDETEVRHAW
jgi:hypothetical protein